MPDPDSPTVQVRLGGRYRTHYGTSVFECVSDQYGINEASGLMSDARFTITDGVETYRCHEDGRQHRSFRTFMDLVEEL
jgi:hypothetical protein